MKRKIVLFLLFSISILFLGGFVTVAWGVQRYGSLGGLVRRVQIEVASMQPRPTVLPTVVPRATVDLAQVAALLEPTPTIRPTETVPPTNTPAVVGTASLPTSQPTATVTPNPTATPLYAPLEEQVYLDGYRHHWQEWNNCAPATLATYLSFWDRGLTQNEAALWLKPNEFDKNVNPAEVVALAEAQGLEAFWMINGDRETVRRLLNNGFPVMIETWLEQDPDDGMGHYRLVVGYDDPAGEWIVSDSYVSENVDSPYRGIRLSSEAFEETWRVFFNTMIVAYPAEQETLVRSIIGDRAEPAVMWPLALESAEAAVRQTPGDGIAWHNLGRVLWELEQSEQAVAAFDQARAAGLPWRMFWYQFDALDAYLSADRPEDVLALTQATIDSGGAGEEVYFWQGMAHEALGNQDAAVRAWHQAMWWHPAHEPTLAKLNE
ncbi:MAG: C39 family peptidase [Ardenticatenaceae bacterium]|nr:C39 family peptidase [Ardenticatenaceae bacterium]